MVGLVALRAAAKVWAGGPDRRGYSPGLRNIAPSGGSVRVTL